MTLQKSFGPCERRFIEVEHEVYGRFRLRSWSGAELAKVTSTGEGLPQMYMGIAASVVDENGDLVLTLDAKGIEAMYDDDQAKLLWLSEHVQKHCMSGTVDEAVKN